MISVTATKISYYLRNPQACCHCLQVRKVFVKCHLVTHTQTTWENCIFSYWLLTLFHYVLPENSSVQISPTGTLIFGHFRSDLSGVYTCSLVYKLIAAQPDKRLTIKYLIYGKLLMLLSMWLPWRRFSF